MLVSVFLCKATSLHAEVMGSVEAFRACCEMSLTQRVTVDSNGFVVSRVVDDVSRMLAAACFPLSHNSAQSSLCNVCI